MKTTFSLFGSGHNRELFYTVGGAFKKLTMPAGGLLTGELLKCSGENVAPLTITPTAIEHASLSSNKNGVFTIVNYSGWSNGTSELASGNGADIVIVYDETTGKLKLPDTGTVLWSSEKQLPDENAFSLIKERCFLMLSADLLRSNGALISKQVSWERTATDALWQLKNNPKFTYLLGAPEILITFSLDGAIYIEQSEGGISAKLVLAHGGFEGETKDNHPNEMPDVWAIMTAMAAKELSHKISEIADYEFNAANVLNAGIDILKSGYVIRSLEEGDYGSWLLNDNTANDLSFNIEASSTEQHADPGFWCIVDGFKNSNIYSIARGYVLEGAKVIDGIPRFSCGALTTVDRREIEAFQNIRNLIVNYEAAKNVPRPLSIAVFGAPGSGKSFGVTQIAKSVLPNVEKLEFNVSQMTSQEDLAAAFHQVRDVVLSGKLPLVFFDEFDSDREGRKLGWLKSFLMPMQDGKFKDQSGEHPIGKCVMVFAGGTSPTFDDFCSPMLDETKLEEFKNIKGPDFVSRLRGTINILGPNPANSNDPSLSRDKNYILRRALLLRSLLERKLKVKSGAMPISSDVLDAMLLTPKFKHGARSMEAILDMSTIDGAWEPASLPFYTQLSLHVDADAFLRLVLKDTVLNAYTEPLAKIIHDDYVYKQIIATQNRGENAANQNDTYTAAWDELPEDIKNANREQAKHIPDKLKLVGCAFDAGDAPYPTLDEFTSDEIMLLAREEHIRFVAQKAKSGWVYGPVRDNDKKIHPCLVDWNKLPKDEQQKDIDAAKNVIPLLKKAGLRVYRMI